MNGNVHESTDTRYDRLTNMNTGTGDNRDDYRDQTDGTLLRRLREGESDAATALYLRYAEKLQRLANRNASPRMAVRVDPDGIVQSVFRTFFRRVTSGQYDVGESSDLWNLLLVIALNKLRSGVAHHRAAKRDVDRTVAMGSDEIGVGNVALPDQNALTVLQMTIEELLQQWPENQRQIIHLRIEGYGVDEISERVGRAKRTVERVLQRFKQELKQVIDE